jgi:Cellulase (glycosyl hydrolase family 5)
MRLTGRTFVVAASVVAFAVGACTVERPLPSVTRPATAVPPAPGATAGTDYEKNPSPPARPVSATRIDVARITGWLHTEGTRIVDQRGRTVRLAGVDVSGMGHGWGSRTAGDGRHGCASWKPPRASEFTNIRRWGFNVVRLSFSWANLQPSRPRGHARGFNTPYVRALQRAVDGFTRRGVAVVLEMAQSHWSPAFGVKGTHHLKCGVGMPTWLYGAPAQGAFRESSGGLTIARAKQDFFSDRDGVQRSYAAAWRYVAHRFSRNRLVVGADMVNEPFTLDAFPLSHLRLGRLYGRVGRAIHRVNPHLLLIFQDSQFHGPGTLALHAPPRIPNAVYTFHLYRSTWHTDAKPMVQFFVRRAQHWDVPLWISEFDAFGYASPRGGPPDWARSLRTMMSFCRRYGVSWSEFSYAKRWLLQPGTNRAKPGLISILRSGM